MKNGREILKTKIEEVKGLIERLILFSVLGEGLEPSRTEVHRILSPVRLPIPPSEQEYKISQNFNFFKIIFLNIFCFNHLYNNGNNNLNYLSTENVY